MMGDIDPPGAPMPATEAVCGGGRGRSSGEPLSTWPLGLAASTGLGRQASSFLGGASAKSAENLAGSVVSLAWKGSNSRAERRAER